MTLPAGGRTVRAAWITFDRGRDIMKFYSDPEVLAFARRHDLALVMPHQCPAKDAPGDDMDMDPKHGIGRALFTALEQFATASGHLELSNAKLFLTYATRGARLPGTCVERGLRRLGPPRPTG
jgi:hypothetical protein